MSIEISFPSIETTSFHEVKYTRSFRGRISTLEFRSTDDLSMGRLVRVNYGNITLFEGYITDKQYDIENDTYVYTAIERVGRYLDRLVKSRPYNWRNLLPEEIIAEIWRYTVNPPYIVLPNRGWIRGGLVIPERNIDESVTYSSSDDYSLKWELSADRWGYPLHSLISRDVLYSSWSDLSYRTDWGSDTSGKLIRWRFTDGAQEYYKTPAENTWVGNSWTANSTLAKMKLIEFDEAPITGQKIVLSLTTAQTDYSDIIGFTYPSMTYVMVGVIDGYIRVKWPNRDTKLLLFYNGDSTLTGNPSDSVSYEAWAYAYSIPSSLAGSYREEHFHTVSGNYLIHVDNSSGGDSLTITIDGEDSKQWTINNGDTLDEHVYLTTGKHQIRIEAGASYAGGSNVKIGENDTSKVSYTVTDYNTQSELNEWLRETGVSNISVLFLKQDTAQGAPDVITLWMDGIYTNIKDEFIRQLSGENRKVSSILTDISQTGWFIKYRDDYPIFLRESALDIVKVDQAFIAKVELEESYDNYISSVKVYGCTRDIVGEAKASDPVFTRELVLTIPWITDGDEAQRYAEKILQRYSVLREIGRVTLVGIFPQFLEPMKVIFDHPLISDTPLTVTEVTYDFTNNTTILTVDIPLNDFLDWLRQTYERQNIEVSYSCPSGCQTTCEVGCESALEHTTCDPTCQSSCQATCEEECQTSCEQGTSCETSCETGQTCEETCENSCQTNCELYIGCQQDCESSCQTTCELNCQTTCETSCQDTCETSCQVSEECSCEYTCETLCENSANEPV